MPDEFYQLKIIVIGEPTVGKTCLVERVTKNTFTPEYKTTLGVDFSSKTCHFNFEGREIELCFQLWDIAGQDYYSKLVHVYYRNAIGCLLVCDLSSEHPLDDIKPWYEEVSRKCFVENSKEEIPTVLICNKFDLEKSVNRWEDVEFCEELTKFKFNKILTVSALTGNGIDDMMQELGVEILETMKEYNMLENQTQPDDSIVQVEDNSNTVENATKKGCC